MNIRSLLFAIFIFSPLFFAGNAGAQIITTFAGNNTPGYSGDGGSALSAAIGAPAGVALDRYGNVFIADGANNVVRKVDASGNISTVAGNGTAGFSGDGGPATSAQLNYPQGIAVDSAGNLYIADDANFVVRMVNTAGTISTFAGTGGVSGYTGDGTLAAGATLYGALAVALDKRGNVYIADGNVYVRVVNKATGIISTYAGSSYGYAGDGGPATLASMAAPAGVALDDTGNLYISDNQNNVIRKVDTFGIITTVAGNGYLAESGGFPPTGGYSGDGGPAIDAELNEPYGLVADKWGNIYFADQSNNVIRKVDATGTITSIVGNGYDASVGYGMYSGDGGLATDATLNYPSAVALDSLGDMYIADQYNYVVRNVAAVSIISASGDSVCSGVSTLFTASALMAGPLTGYQWKVNGINQGTDSSAFVTDSLHNGDVITCTVVNAANDSAIVTSNAITMYVTPTVIPMLTVSSPTGHNDCPVNAMTFVATVVNCGSSPTFKWGVNDSLILTGSADTFMYSPTPVVTAAGMYVVNCSVQSSAACAVPPTVTAPLYAVTVDSIVTPSVTALATGGDTLCAGVAVVVAAIAVNGGMSPTFQWSVNGVNTATGPTYSYFPSTGDLVKVFMTSSACSSPDTTSSASIKLTVSPLITPSLTITASADSICPGNTITFNTFPIYPGLTPVFQWKKDGADVATGTTYAYVPAEGDVISCTLTSDAACSTTDTATSNDITMTVLPTVIPAVTFSVSPGDTVCAGTTELFTATGINGGAAPVFTWYIDGAIAGSGATFSYEPASGDVIRCLLNSSAACAIPDTATSGTATLIVHPALVPSVSISAATGYTVCAGTAVDYTAATVNGGASPLYQWRVNGINEGTGSSYSYTPANGDAVSCTLISDALCATPDSATNSVTMAVDTTVIPSVTIAASTGDSICAGTPVTYSATATNGGASPVFEWKKDGTDVSSGSSYTYTPAAGDMITCELTSDALCTATDTALSTGIALTVMADVTPVVSITSSTTTVTSSGQIVTFTAAATGGGTAPGYQWEINGTPVTGATSSTFADSFATSDSVRCILTSNAPCASPATVASGNIGITASLGVAQLSGTITNLILSPNPNNGTFAIEGTTGDQADCPATVAITDMLGRTVYQTTSSTQLGKINATLQLDGTLAAGVYLLHVASGGYYGALQFVIEKK